MIFKLIKLLVIGALVIGLAVFVRTEIMHYWNDKLVKEARDFKVPSSDLHFTKTTTSTASACASNTLSQLVLVSIGGQHLWACDGTSQVYDSAVVTGMELYPADLTPTGTYHVYAKETDQYLKGCDSTGCWDDFVNYWMPFLDNQYGEYGFHDATWRTASEFGNVNIYAPYTASVVGSHGCVELPLATAKWLYAWTQIGTTVQIES